MITSILQNTGSKALNEKLEKTNKRLIPVSSGGGGGGTVSGSKPTGTTTDKTNNGRTA